MLQNPVHVVAHLVLNKLVTLFLFFNSLSVYYVENLIVILRYPHISQMEI